MKLIKQDFFYSVLIFFITIITVFDLFANVGRSANMDGIAHTTTIAMFSQALHEGFPIRWINGFANYGYPLGIVAHQLPTYLGAIVNLFLRDPVVSYNIICFIGLLGSNIFYYFFLRIYFTPLIAFMSTFLFNFTPYRIINLYIRGAIPEAFSNIFLPLILLSIYFFIKKRKVSALFLFIVSISALALTHPMTLLIYSFIFIPYILFCLYVENEKIDIKSLYKIQKIKVLLVFLVAIIVGLGIASYYIIPLNIEIKYFYYGLQKNHLTLGKYMGLANYFDPNWYYYTKEEIFPRGHFITAGVIETIGVLCGVVYILIRFIKNKQKQISLLEFSVLVSLLIIFFTTSYADILYTHINLLSNIQFPWRMLSSFVFLPPIIFAYLFQRINRNIFVVAFIIFISIVRFPQLYGKNYAMYPKSFYTFTPNNLHSTVMNTIWSGRTEDYPVKNVQAEIIEGNGKITSTTVKNSSRQYKIDANTSLRMVDYTFYFPGWNVYVDDKKTDIQFQDSNYRGIITYTVAPGNHTIFLKFEDTTVRAISYKLSVLFFFLTGILFLLRKKLSFLLPK